MNKVILTGFEPFGGDSINPALEVIKVLEKEPLPGVEILPLRLPVVFGKAIEEVIAAIKSFSPSLIISVGQAGGRPSISVERLGININNARIADNAGNQPRDEVIVADGPAAYFTTIDCQKTVEAIKEKDIPATISYHASTFVCNNLIYGTLHYLASHHLPIKFGFLHVPFLPEQAAKKEKEPPAMKLSSITESVKVAIKANLPHSP